jgi:hypothetical protein
MPTGHPGGDHWTVFLLIVKTQQNPVWSVNLPSYTQA